MKILRQLGTCIVALCLFCTGSFLAGYKLYGGPGIFPNLRAMAEFRAVVPHLESLGTGVEGLLNAGRTAPTPGRTVASLGHAHQGDRGNASRSATAAVGPCPDLALVDHPGDHCQETGGAPSAPCSLLP